MSSFKYFDIWEMTVSENRATFCDILVILSEFDLQIQFKVTSNTKKKSLKKIYS